MKKLLFAVAVLFSLNSKAQDTTYLQKRQDLYMSIKTKVIDSTNYKKYYSAEKERIKRRDKRITIITGIVWGSITGWYLMKP
jgi:hypothetical protein